MILKDEIELGKFTSNAIMNVRNPANERFALFSKFLSGKMKTSRCILCIWKLRFPMSEQILIENVCDDRCVLIHH